MFGPIEAKVPSPTVLWHVKNSGSEASGVPALALPSPELMVTANGCTAALAPGEQCIVQVSFRPSQTGMRSAALTVSASPGGSATVQAVAEALWRLTVTVNSPVPNVKVDVSTPMVSCTGTCSFLYPDAQPVTLVGLPLAPFNATFLGWSPSLPCLPGPPPIRCDLVMMSSLEATATFIPRVPSNLAFVSSASYSGALGGVVGANFKCDQLAFAAGINNPGSSWVAWLSANGDPAADKISDGGISRIDAVPFAFDRQGLLSGEILSPLNVDEFGRTLDAGETIWTGTFADGTPASKNCNNWTSNQLAATGWSGVAGGGPGLWTSIGEAACNAPHRLYCVSKGSNVRLSKPTVPINARTIYYTTVPFTPGGPLTPDKFCEMHPPLTGLPPGRLVALISHLGIAPDQILDPLASYVRIDGVTVGTGSDLIAGHALNGIWQRSDRSYLPGPGNVWSGAQDLTTASNETCDDWRDADAGSAAIGTINMGGTLTDWFGSSSASCRNGLPLICFQTP
jgi:hypothetical protein